MGGPPRIDDPGGIRKVAQWDPGEGDNKHIFPLFLLQVLSSGPAPDSVPALASFRDRL